MFEPVANKGEVSSLEINRNFILKSDIKILGVADKGNVAVNVGEIMTMITNNYFTQGDGWGTHPTKGGWRKIKTTKNGGQSRKAAEKKL